MDIFSGRWQALQVSGSPTFTPRIQQEQVEQERAEGWNTFPPRWLRSPIVPLQNTLNPDDVLPY